MVGGYSPLFGRTFGLFVEDEVRGGGISPKKLIEKRRMIMKKIVSVLTGIVLLASLTACGGNGGKLSSKACPAEKTVDGFMQALVTYDWDDLDDYTSGSDVSGELTDGLDEITEGLESLASLGIDTDKINEVMKKVMGTIEYKIVKCDDDEESAEVLVEVSVPDFDSIDFDDEEVLMDLLGVSDEEEMLEKYTGKTMDELYDIDEDEAEELMADMISKMIDDMADGLVDMIEDGDKLEEQVTFTVEAEDGEWLISEVETD